MKEQEQNSNLPIFTAKEFFKFKKITENIEPPDVILLCFIDSLFDKIVKKIKNKRIKGFFGDVRVLKTKTNKIGVAGKFGIGAPITAVLTEDFHQWGVKKIIGIGMGSSISTSIRIGDIIVIDKAIRDEGTSFHYEKDETFAFASQEFLSKIINRFKFTQLKFIIGSTWTTDAPYRETADKVTKFQNEGIRAVEMECASLYTVAKYCNMQSLFLLCISDSVATLKWEFRNNLQELNKNLLQLITELLEFLTNEHI